MPERPGLLWDDSGICIKPLWEHEPKIDDIIKVFLRLGFAHNRDQLHVSVLGQGAINKAYRVQIKLGKGEDERGRQPAFMKWRTMSMDQKKRLVEQIASYQHELTALPFDSIGTLREEDGYAPGQIVNMEFCFGDHFSYNINRGPFHCARDWFKALTDIIILDRKQELEEEDLDRVERFLCEGYLRIIERLRELIPTLFSDTTPERTVLWHHDLSLTNILVSPRFLRGRDRHEEPHPDRYYHGNAPPVDRWGRNNKGRSTKYRDGLMDYEMTVLQARYDSCRRHHDPRWKKDLTKDEKLKYDFLDAINLCRAQDLGGVVDEWIDSLEEGDIIPLEYSD
ncbi:kinase-like protein [Fusarium flagelliforme]|uniref:Kinase-like protein n=1 Tax=Fusarium flagelliforme TaxID=2675880 RepID=A0A395MBV2_9HYPO|nr:kinase-like protein [Fusarium flagelliforme]